MTLSEPEKQELSDYWTVEFGGQPSGTSITKVLTVSGRILKCTEDKLNRALMIHEITSISLKPKRKLVIPA